MRRRQAGTGGSVIVLLLLPLLAVAACTAGADRRASGRPGAFGPEGTPPAVSPTSDPPALVTPTGNMPPTARSAPANRPLVVNFDGVGNVRFGATKANLTSGGQLQFAREGCGSQLSDAPELGPVFDGEKLVLLWVNPPYHTPEGMTVGSKVGDVRQAYKNAEVLTPPAGSYVFPGLLEIRGDRAYLFLHDDSTVQKTIVGYTEYARKLYTDGFGQC